MALGLPTLEKKQSLATKKDGTGSAINSLFEQEIQARNQDLRRQAVLVMLRSCDCRRK